MFFIYFSFDGAGNTGQILDEVIITTEWAVSSPMLTSPGELLSSSCPYKGASLPASGWAESAAIDRSSYKDSQRQA